MPYRRTLTALAGALIALAAGAPSALAWHVTAQCQYVNGNIVAAATWSPEFQTGAGTHLEIYRVDRQRDQFKQVAASAPGVLTSSLSYPVPNTDELTGQPATTARSYFAKAWFDVAEGGFSKSQDCVVQPPVPGCNGQTYPPGVPLPVCAPPVTPPAPPPVVTPPVPPQPPTVTPPTPAPKCVGPYHVTRSRGSVYRFRLRDERGIKHLAHWKIDGKPVPGLHRTLSVPRSRLVGAHSVSAMSKGLGCYAARRVNVRPPSAPPRFAG